MAIPRKKARSDLLIENALLVTKTPSWRRPEWSAVQIQRVLGASAARKDCRAVNMRATSQRECKVY
jgi:hypothetical protein